MQELADAQQAVHLARFFKTAPGSYGEGDRFLGIRVPQTRAIVKKYRSEVTLDDTEALLASQWHEARLAGFLLLTEIYRRSKRTQPPQATEHIIKLYIDRIPRGNNWDLVDLVCYSLLGDWLVDHPDKRTILYELAASDSLWHQRVSIVTTYALIRAGLFDDTIRIATTLLNHPHDLIHKATGWMLREIGKRDEPLLLTFLDNHARTMPRTTLRYAIERLTPGQRAHYMTMH